LKLSVTGLLAAMGAIVAVASFCGLAGRYAWLLDLASHFRVQYCIVLGVAAVGLGVVQRYKIAIFFGVVALFNLALLIPFYVGADHADAEQDQSLRAFLVNVHTSNRDHAAVLDSIDRYDPDFVVAEEVNQRWLSVLETLNQRYPYVVSRPRGDNFGIVLLSKHPFVDSRVVSLSALGIPSILAEFELQGKRFHLLATHTLPPVSPEYARFRNEHLEAIPQAVAGLDAPVLLLGDLNVTPWSHFFRRLLRDSGLRNASRGRGIQPTWPTFRRVLLIPIDHCLHSPEIAVIDKRVGSHLGSDHYPVIVDFVP
jgi:endonuclease/exonuclease/phosphatase (EEP) superfamily protein YafD